MPGRAKPAVSFITALAVAVTAAGTPMVHAQSPAQAPAAAMSRAEYEACQTREDDAFRSAIAAITQKALTEGMASIDFKQLVKDQWRAGDLDRVVATRVDLAVAEVRDENTWSQLLKSLGSKEKAQELATAVAERVYRSDAMKTAIEGLATGVARDMGRHLELAMIKAADPAVRCLEAYLGPRYGGSIAGFVTAGADSVLAAGGDPGSAEVSSGDILKQSTGGITGVAVLVLRRQMANIARRLGQRLVGSVLSRLVSVAAGGVGLVLIAKDIWDLRHGVLPIIADEMKAESTKENVRAELASALSEQINDHIKEIAAKAAENVVEVWQSFRRAHIKVLELAETNTRFRDYLNGLAAAQLPRLDAVVALTLESEGEGGIMRRLDDGSLDRAVSHLPAPGMEIAQASRSLDAGLKWSAVAGDHIAAIVANEIHLRAKPEDFSSASLQRLFAIDDRLAIARVASVSRGARDALFDLAPDELKSLARSFDSGELETLAGYLSGLQQEPRARVLQAVAASPAAMQLIAPQRVRRAILASRDQMAAVDMMLRPQGILDPTAAYQDMRRAWNGDVSPLLIWEKHPAAVMLLGVLALFLLLVVQRLLTPRRARDESARDELEPEPAAPPPQKPVDMPRPMPMPRETSAASAQGQDPT